MSDGTGGLFEWRRGSKVADLSRVFVGNTNRLFCCCRDYYFYRYVCMYNRPCDAGTVPWLRGSAIKV